jgi:hypothetical protein
MFSEPEDKGAVDAAMEQAGPLRGIRVIELSTGIAGGYATKLFADAGVEWSTAQRRAIIVRDAGHCRFPGCTFSAM